jgi:hypothetical protein
MKRETNKQKAEKLAEIKALSARYVTEEGLAIFTSISASTFTKLRCKQTPKRWSIERIKEVMAKGELIGPPYIEVGDKILYDLYDVVVWMGLFPKMGILPDMVAEMERVA